MQRACMYTIRMFVPPWTASAPLEAWCAPTLSRFNDQKFQLHIDVVEQNNSSSLSKYFYTRL